MNNIIASVAEVFQEWRQFVAVALSGMLMICLESWTFEIGAVIIGKYWRFNLRMFPVKICSLL